MKYNLGMPISANQVLGQAKANTTEITPKEAYQNFAQFQFVDVREDHEIEAGIIQGASHVPRGYLETRIQNVLNNKPIVLYCASGTRSALSAWTLQRDFGLENVFSLKGGYTAWKDQGYDTQVPFKLSAEQKQRYSRHLLIPEIGFAGQEKLLNAKVLLLGAGGLGSPVALYLAAAGVGKIGIVDDDVVELSNLQRQIIHSTKTLYTNKAASAQKAIEQLNPDTKVQTYQTRLDRDNVLDILNGYDVVVDGADNFPTRYLLNDASVRLGIPVVSAAILGFESQLSVFIPQNGPCYRCVFPSPPPAELAPTCGVGGVLGVLPGTTGLLQATEVIKLITEAGEPLVGRILMYDALSAETWQLKTHRDPECPVCSKKPDNLDINEFQDYEAFCAV